MHSAAYAITRFEGRDFTHYTSNFGSLDHLGRAFTMDVPRGREEYEEWLDATREDYALQTSQLNYGIFPFTEQELLTEKDEKHIEKLGRISRSHNFLALKMPVCDIPCSRNVAHSYKPVEWIYIIDLDNQLFIIDHRGLAEYGKIYFNLWNIPQDRWFHNIQRHGFSFTLCPEALVGPKHPKQSVKNGRADNLSKLLLDITCHKKRVQPLRHRIHSRQMTALMLFHHMAAFPLKHWWTEIADDGPSTFAFREVAFAILSLAAGQYYLERSDRCTDFPWDHEYYLDLDDFDRPRVMPNLGTEFVLEGRDPGSSPHNKNMYWFENVLINLVDDDILLSDFSSAILRIRSFAREHGKTNFLALLFSIRNVIMLEFYEGDEGQIMLYTDAIPIYDISMSTLDRQYMTREVLFARYKNFASLQRFFTIAVRRRLQCSRDTIPLDICAEVFDILDPATQNTCASVSPHFRSLATRKYKASRGLSILGLKRGSTGQCTTHIEMSPDGSKDQSGFIFRNGTIEDAANFVYSEDTMGLPRRDRSRTYKWQPVVGSWLRSSIVLLVSLTFKLRGKHQGH